MLQTHLSALCFVLIKVSLVMSQTQYAFSEISSVHIDIRPPLAATKLILQSTADQRIFQLQFQREKRIEFIKAFENDFVWKKCVRSSQSIKSTRSFIDSRLVRFALTFL